MIHWKQQFLSRPLTLIPALALVLVLCLAAGPASAVDFDVKDTRVSIGGYLKLMMNYDMNGTLANNTNHPTDGDILTAYDAPLDGTTYGDEENFSMTARESRIYMKTATQSEYGLISTYLEGDANGDVGGSPAWSNSRSFRLRHGFGSLRSGPHTLIAGQTWSTFMDLAAAVPSLDLGSDPGLTFVRQPQVRYTYQFDKGHYLSLAAENPDRGLTANGNGSLFVDAGNSTDPLPDVIVKYFRSFGRFHVSPKLLVRKFELSGETTTGWGLSLSSRLAFGKGHKLYAGLLYGDGMGRYGGLGINGGAGLTGSGEIETVEFKSFNTGVTFALRDNLAWTVGCGYSENDESAYSGPGAVLTGSANREAFSWHTNLIWKITPTLEYAVGFIGMDQEVMDGREGDMMRIQNYFKYRF